MWIHDFWMGAKWCTDTKAARDISSYISTQGLRFLRKNWLKRLPGQGKKTNRMKSKKRNPISHWRRFSFLSQNVTWTFRKYFPSSSYSIKCSPYAYISIFHSIQMNFIILFRISEQKKEREKTVGVWVEEVYSMRVCTYYR